MPEFPKYMLLDRSSFPSKVHLPDILGYTSKVFGLKLSPHWHEAEAQSYAWFDNYHVHSGTKRQRFFDFALGLFTALVYPDASLERLRIATDFMLWLFAFDDMTDQSEGELRNKVLAAKLAIKVNMDVLRSPESPPPELRIAASLHSCFNRMRTNGSPANLQRLVNTIDFYTESILQQTRNRSVDVVPTVDQFIQLRRNTSGARLVFVVLEYALDITLPEHILSDPILAELVECGNDIISWANDIYSCPIELAHGDTHNLVLIAMRNKRINLEEAIDYVDQLVRQRLKQYEAAKAQLQSFGPKLDDQVTRYIQGLEYSVMGTIHWAFATPRYFGKHFEKVKETGIVDIVLPSDDLAVHIFLKE